MNKRLILRIISMTLLVEAVFLVPPLIICLLDGEPQVALSFLYTMLAVGVFSGIGLLISRKCERRFHARDGFVATGLAWIFLSLFGALPFFISGQIPNYIDCFFEVVSGFTTTGASILNDVEALSRGLLFWRSFTHWLGGMGVLVFLLAVVPKIIKDSGSELHILRAESPGPSVDKFTPHMRSTAMTLYLIYIGLTVLDVIFLVAGGMPLFDSLCTAFGTAGTGGFGVRNDSMASYSPYLQNVTTIFMALFGVNFNVYFLIVMRKYKKALFDEELRAYVLILLGAAALITINLIGMYPTFGETVRHAAFQTSSIMTTTGFSTVDFDVWPTFSKTILLILMCIGACAGSTGGGIKVSRLVILAKSARRNLHKTLHPRRVEIIRFNGEPLAEQTVKGVSSYLIAYCAITLLSILIIAIDGMSIETNLSAVLACFNNIGPGMDAVGATCSYFDFSWFSKLVLSFDMLLGRLEIYPIMLMFTRSVWKRSI